MHAIGIEIPATDLRRAKRFYESVFGHAPTDVLMEEGRVRTIIEGTPGIFLNQTAGFTPSTEGSLPYFHVEDLDAAVVAVTAAGGRVLQAPAPRGDLGRFAHVLDSEGNALYLHGT